jgi:hypothetical protein
MLCRLVEAGQLPPLTETVEWKMPGEESAPRPPAGYVVSFVALHECGFSIPAERFIRVVLFEYGLQLQHLNSNSIQQMAVFVVMFEGYLWISAHWHLFRYFFMFLCLKDGSRAATIGCANLWMNLGRGENYISSSLTSSNSGWHKGWFYLRNNPEFALSAFTGNSIGQAWRNWTDDPQKAELEKMLKDHWVVLTHLREARVTLVTVIGQYHARGGGVPLRDDGRQSPWTGTMAIPAFPSLNEIQCCVALAIGKSIFTWPLARLLPMLPNGETKKFVSCFFFRQVLHKIGFLDLCRSSRGFLMIADLPAPCFSVEVRPSRAGEGISPGGGDLQAQSGARREAAGCAPLLPSR